MVAFCVIAYVLKAVLTLALSDIVLISFEALYLLVPSTLGNLCCIIFVSGLSLLYLYVLASIMIDFNCFPLLLDVFLSHPYIDDMLNDIIHGLYIYIYIYIYTHISHISNTASRGSRLPQLYTGSNPPQNSMKSGFQPPHRLASSPAQGATYPQRF